MSRKNSQRAERKRQRLNRLPPFARRLISDHGMARVMLATAPFTRQMFAAGLSPTPGMGVAEFDACVSLVKDALGLVPLSDEAFEHALRLSTPPECPGDLAMIAQNNRHPGDVFAHETDDEASFVRTVKASEGGPMMGSITLLRAGSNKSLAKIWTTDGHITPAANATWFEGLVIPVGAVQTSASYST